MIRNHNILKNNFECGKILGEYLQKHGIPVLNVGKNHKYYFRNTQSLKEVLNKIPLGIRILELIF